TQPAALVHCSPYMMAAPEAARNGAKLRRHDAREEPTVRRDRVVLVAWTRATVTRRNDPNTVVDGESVARARLGRGVPVRVLPIGRTKCSTVSTSRSDFRGPGARICRGVADTRPFTADGAASSADRQGEHACG